MGGGVGGGGANYVGDGAIGRFSEAGLREYPL